MKNPTLEQEQKWSPLSAVEAIEEWGNPVQKVEALAYLIVTGLVWELQGFYGRMAQQYMDAGVINDAGEINWDEFYAA